MRALVTGANGFVGSHLCRKLIEQGAEVRGLVRSGSDRRLLEGLDVELIEGDVSDGDCLPRAVEGCEHIYHTAAMVRFFVPNSDREHMIRANVEGTRNVLEAAARSSAVKRVIHTSTTAVLERRGNGAISDETMVAREDQVIGLYELTKLQSQKMALDAAREGLPVTVVNVAGPAGPGDLKPSPMGRVVLMFLRGRIPAYTDTGLCVVDVRDVAAGHVLAAEAGQPGECYVLGGENLKLSDFFGLLQEVSGVRAPRVRIPYAVSLLGGMLGEISGRLTRTQPLACMASVRMSRNPHYASSEKARRELGYSPRPIRECLADEVAYYRGRGLV